MGRLSLWITFFFVAMLLRCAVDDQKDSALRADGDATQTKSTLRAAIGAKDGDEYDVLISGAKNIDRVAVCVAKTAEECKDDQTKTFLATLAKDGEPRIFKSERKVKIEAGLRLMVVARDAAGEKVDDLVAEFRAKGDDGFEKYTEGMALAETLTLKGPVAYRVFQRTTKDEGPVRVEFERPAATVKYVRSRLLDVGAAGEAGPWHQEAVETTVVDYEMKGPAGGWYQLEVLLYGEDKKILARQVVEKVGVGEVFVVAGQSNSTNCGATPTSPKSGLVASTDGVRWKVGDDPQIGAHDADLCAGGSSWPAAGDKLAEKYKVPVAFASTGYSGTAVAEWLPGAGGKGLFGFTMQRVQQLGKNGFRAVLWHQGENDVKDRTPTDTYYQNLKTIIDQSRATAAWEFPWLVAEAAWCRQIEAYNIPEQEPEITGAQKKLAADLDYVFPGPNTDQFGLEFRGTNCHFNERGSQATGEAWAEKIGAFLDGVLQ